MPKGVPKAGFRKTKNWMKRVGDVGGRMPVPRPTPVIAMPVVVPALPTMPVVETDRDILSRLIERYEILGQMADAVIAGDVRSLIVAGPAGVGKSYLIEEKLGAFGEENSEWEIVKGYSTPMSLFKVLYKYRNEGQVLVLDDADNILFDEVGLNLLKAATDTSSRRRVAWRTKAEILDDDGMPIEQSFDFNGSIIFVSNVDFDGQIERGTKIAPHLQALVSRALYLSMDMRSSRDTMIWIRHMVTDGDMLADYGLTEDQSKEVLDFMAGNLHTLREVSLRTAVKAAKIRASNAAKWDVVAKLTLCKG